MVDIIHFALAVTDADQLFHYLDDVVFAQDTGAFDFITQQGTVELHTTNRRQVIAVFGEEQVLEQAFSRFTRRWFTRTHHAVDLNQRAQAIVGWVDTYGLGDISTVIQIVGEQRFDTLVTRLAQLSQQIQAQFHVRRANQLASGRINIVFSGNFTCDVLHRYFDLFNFVFFQLADVARGDTATFFHIHFAVKFDVERRGFTTQALRYELHLQLIVADFENNFVKEQVKDLFSGVVQCTQNDGRRQFTATVNTHKQVVFRIEFEVQPGTTVRNDTCVIKHFTR